MPANMYHWISSQPLELSLKRYRLNALPALIRQANNTKQFATTAIRALTQSMTRLSPKRTDMLPPCRSGCTLKVHPAHFQHFLPHDLMRPAPCTGPFSRRNQVGG